MIFKSFDTLKDKKEKNFFKEQISVYIRLVEVFCEKHGVEFKTKEHVDITDELIDIGVINNSLQVEEFIFLLYYEIKVFSSGSLTSIAGVL